MDHSDEIYYEVSNFYVRKLFVQPVLVTPETNLRGNQGKINVGPMQITITLL